MRAFKHGLSGPELASGEHTDQPHFSPDGSMLTLVELSSVELSPTLGRPPIMRATDAAGEPARSRSADGGALDGYLLREERRIDALASLEILDTLPEREYDDLTELAAYICGTPIALVSLVAGERQWFKSSFGLGLQETPRSESFCTHTIEHSDLFIVPDAQLDPRFCDLPVVTGEMAIRFYAGTPILSPDGYAVGSLCVLDDKPRDLTEEQATALRVLARQAATYLLVRRQLQELTRSTAQRVAAEQELSIYQEQLERANGRLRELAMTDSLTGLRNRRALEERLREEQLAPRESALPLSLLMIDVDHFKSINDTQGHDAGDRTLQRIAQVLRDAVRGWDLVCRYGGEEFVVLLAEVDATQAMLLAERLRTSILETFAQSVTVSTGVATASGDGIYDAVPQLLGRADRAMYEAKQAGRNCVRAAKPDSV